jgi:hypothetical protein
MTLNRSNPHLKSVAQRKFGLRLSAQSSSAVEGIRAPFAKGKRSALSTSVKAFVAHWKRHASETV